MRGLVRNIPIIGRTAGCVLVAMAIIAVALHFHPREPSRPSATNAAALHADPLAAALARCQALGMAAESDAAYQTTWDENRRRFFTYKPAPEAR